MSYSVIHMQKLKMGAMKGIENHNERLKESRTNPDIVGDRSHLNYGLHRSDDLRTYYMRVKDRISELKLKKAVRKDAVVSVGFITTSDKAFFNSLTPEKVKNFFQVSYDFLKERYGEKNVISSKVHLDETTPHMHTYLVPVTKDNRLSAKSIFTPIELKNLQMDYNKHMRENGFNLEKGESNRKHVKMAEFKKQTAYKQLEEIEKKLKGMIAEKNTVKNDLKALKNDLNSVKDIKASFDQINAIQGKYGFISKKKIKVKTEDFDMLKNIGKQQHVLESKIERLESDNKDMQHDLNTFKEQNMNTYKKKIEREKEIKSMVNKFNGMTKEIDMVRDYLTKNNQLDDYNDYRNFKNKQKEIKKHLQKNKDFDLER